MRDAHQSLLATRMRSFDITRIAGAGRVADEPAYIPDAKSVAAAAQAFAERTRARMSGAAHGQSGGHSGGLAA